MSQQSKAKTVASTHSKGGGKGGEAVYEVEIILGSSQVNYWALLRVMKDGKLHRKEIAIERKASQQSNILAAAIEALNTLNQPCMLDIKSTEEYLINPLKENWIRSWEQHEWRNAKGRVVRNAEQWKEIRRLLSNHSARFHLMRKGEE